jgi:hypothetical protein
MICSSLFSDTATDNGTPQYDRRSERAYEDAVGIDIRRSI